MSKLLNFLNDMPPRQVLMLSGAVAVVMFAFIFFVLSFLTDSKKVEEGVALDKPVSEMVSVVAAKSDISPRTMIRENMVQLKQVSADMVPDGAIKNVTEIVNVPARTMIFAGDILTENKVYMDMGQAGFVGSIPPNCRAVSIDVNSVTSVDGFAKPGDYVDLLLVEKDNKTVTTNVLLQNILLLSINQNMNTDTTASTENSENSNTTAIDNPSIATLALKPDEAIQLISASKLGEIYLMLRPFKPTDMYIDELEYTATAANAVQNYNEPSTPQAMLPLPSQTFNPPTNSTVPLPVTNLPTPNPSANVPANVPQNVPAQKIEIIQGDKVVQNTEKK